MPELCDQHVSWWCVSKCRASVWVVWKFEFPGLKSMSLGSPVLELIAFFFLLPCRFVPLSMDDVPHPWNQGPSHGFRPWDGVEELYVWYDQDIIMRTYWSYVCMDDGWWWWWWFQLSTPSAFGLTCGYSLSISMSINFYMGGCSQNVIRWVDSGLVLATHDY